MLCNVEARQVETLAQVMSAPSDVGGKDIRLQGKMAPTEPTEFGTK